MCKHTQTSFFNQLTTPCIVCGAETANPSEVCDFCEYNWTAGVSECECCGQWRGDVQDGLCDYCYAELQRQEMATYASYAPAKPVSIWHKVNEFLMALVPSL